MTDPSGVPRTDVTPGQPSAPVPGAAARPAPLLAAAAVGLGGAVGALARAGVGELVPGQPGTWAWSTLAVNTTGGFALGALLALLAAPAPRTPYPRLLLGTGVLGGYTTFSAFSMDVVGLLDAGRPAVALAYALCSVAVLLVATVAGGRVVRGAAGRSR